MDGATQTLPPERTLRAQGKGKCAWNWDLPRGLSAGLVWKRTWVNEGCKPGASPRAAHPGGWTSNVAHLEPDPVSAHTTAGPDNGAPHLEHRARLTIQILLAAHVSTSSYF